MKRAALPTWHPPSTLFTVRVWRAGLGAAPEQLCMQVKHVLSGETLYFRDWAQLVEYLEDKLQVPEQIGQKKEK